MFRVQGGGGSIGCGTLPGGVAPTEGGGELRVPASKLWDVVSGPRTNPSAEPTPERPPFGDWPPTEGDLSGEATHESSPSGFEGSSLVILRRAKGEVGGDSLPLPGERLIPPANTVRLRLGLR